MSQAPSDGALRHLQQVAEWPDLSATRYDIVERVGRGGMGTVYRAHDHGLDRPVALKVLSLPYAGEVVARRLEREAKVLATLEHPGIVPVHDVGTLPDGRVFYTMKLVRGRRLDQLLTDVSSIPERLRWFLRVAEAIAFAHSRGVIHRDIKPENIMVGAFGEVLVLDWGIAKVTGEVPSEPATTERAPPAIEGESGATEAGTVLGTPGYMSPEQAAGEVALIDERSDVYALGALLAVLVSGRPPRPGRVVSEPSGRLPKRLRAIIQRASAPVRAHRYPTVTSLAADVTRYLDGAPVSAYRERWWERLARIAGNYRTPILLVLAYLIIRLVLLYVRR